jgi:hypothetical protein
MVGRPLQTPAALALAVPFEMFARRVRTDRFFDPCIPSRAAKPPSGPVWVHEVKHDGYRLIVRRDGEAVRLFTRRGYDWTDCHPAIASAAGRLAPRVPQPHPRASPGRCNVLILAAPSRLR